MFTGGWIRTKDLQPRIIYGEPRNGFLLAWEHPPRIAIGHILPGRTPMAEPAPDRWLPIPAFEPVQQAGLTWRLDEFHMAIRRGDGVDIHGQLGTAPLFHVPAGVPHVLLPVLLNIYQEGWSRGFHGHRQSSGQTVPRREFLP